MQYFWLIRGIHISTRNLVFLYQGVVKSSLIAQNYVFMTPPLTILFFRRIRPRHSWEQLLQQSPHPNMHPLHSAIRSNSDFSPNIFISVAITWLCCANNTPGDRYSPGNPQFLCRPHDWAPACARTLLPSLRSLYISRHVLLVFDIFRARW